LGIGRKAATDEPQAGRLFAVLDNERIGGTRSHRFSEGPTQGVTLRDEVGNFLFFTDGVIV
jgi:hypothetical protein